LVLREQLVIREQMVLVRRSTKFNMSW